MSGKVHCYSTAVICWRKQLHYCTYSPPLGITTSCENRTLTIRIQCGYASHKTTEKGKNIRISDNYKRKIETLIPQNPNSHKFLLANERLEVTNLKYIQCSILNYITQYKIIYHRINNIPMKSKLKTNLFKKYR